MGAICIANALADNGEVRRPWMSGAWTAAAAVGHRLRGPARSSLGPHPRTAQAELLAVMHNTGIEHGAGAISVLNTYYGRGDVPIGRLSRTFPLPATPHPLCRNPLLTFPRFSLSFSPPLVDAPPPTGPVHELQGAYKGDFDSFLLGPYVDDLVASFPSPIKNRSQVPDAVALYRETLAKQQNDSVVIASIGFTTNLHPLLQSKPDMHR